MNSSLINTVNKRPKLSGAANRKRKLSQENEQVKLRKSMNIFLQKKDENVHIGENSTIELTGTVDSSCPNDDIENVDSCPTVTRTSKVSVPIKSVQKIDLNKASDSFKKEPADLADISNWPNFRSTKITDYLIIKGPIQIFLPKNKYPKDEEGRHFSNYYFKKVMPNGESFPRRWLVYSLLKNAVFCFCCKIFRPPSDSKLCNNGVSTWKHLSDKIKTHEESTSHKQCYQKWVEAEIRLKKGKTIDIQQQKLIQKEYERWQNVLVRLMYIILYLSSNNMGFRGSSCWKSK